MPLCDILSFHLVSETRQLPYLELPSIYKFWQHMIWSYGQKNLSLVCTHKTHCLSQSGLNFLLTAPTLDPSCHTARSYDIDTWMSICKNCLLKLYLFFKAQHGWIHLVPVNPASAKRSADHESKYVAYGRTSWWEFEAVCYICVAPCMTRA
jgi:hypothetical protein